MNICPSCDEEFLDHVSLCSTCGKKLIQAEHRLNTNDINKLRTKEELLKQETVALSEGSLDHCREFEKILNKSHIACVVYPAKLGCDDHSTALGASCAVKYLVLVSPADIENCQKALEGHFNSQVVREGQGDFVREIVDISQEEVSCPACGERSALVKGECRSCGLFLGEQP
jgi:hypothetical protein